MKKVQIKYGLILYKEILKRERELWDFKTQLKKLGMIIRKKMTSPRRVKGKDKKHTEMEKKEMGI